MKSQIKISDQIIIEEERKPKPIDEKRIELLVLTAKLAVYISVHGSSPGSADMCNLHELALAGLGYDDDSPQVPLDKIVECVKKQLNNET